MGNLLLSWHFFDGRLAAKWSQEPESAFEVHGSEMEVVQFAGQTGECAEPAEAGSSRNESRQNDYRENRTRPLHHSSRPLQETGTRTSGGKERLIA
jgi:hypothetical protein